VSSTDNQHLIAAAVSVLNPHVVGGRFLGDVGCALTTLEGEELRGICIDTASGTGFCAEAAGIAAMVTAGTGSPGSSLSGVVRTVRSACCRRAGVAASSSARSTKPTCARRWSSDPTPPSPCRTCCHGL